MCIGMQTYKELIGNMIVLLANRCKPLYHTKLLKLLYLIDEEATRRTGAPITWLKYNVWQFGPVSEDVYYSKMYGYNKFNDFVLFEPAGENAFIIRPISDFDDSEFSELDLEIINDVLDKYGKMNTQKLVNMTHAKDSLWKKTKERSGIQFSENSKTNDVPINFVDLIANDNFRKSVCYSTLENVELQSTLI